MTAAAAIVLLVVAWGGVMVARKERQPRLQVEVGQVDQLKDVGIGQENQVKILDRVQ